MTMRFLHAADIHLGYLQYGCDERYNDFARAFERLVDETLVCKADFLLLAGDLFHKRSIDPLTLLQATYHLKRLKERGVSAIAVEGNHERSHYGERFSWVDYLANTGLLVLLSPAYDDKRMVLNPWDGEQGAYIDLPGGVRVLGVKYYGASTPRVVGDLTEAIPQLLGTRPACTILLLHAGLEGVLDHYSATLTRAQLEPLRPHVDYVALGHIHKPFVQDNWIYNPGSLETTSVDELAWEERGYFQVEITPARTPGHSATLVRSQRRAFERVVFPVDRYETPDALYKGLESVLQRQATPARVARRPVLELRLTGVLAFNPSDLELARVHELAETAFEPIFCQIKDLTAPNEFEIRTDEALTRAELEQRVISELLERDVRRRDASAYWAGLVLRLKQMALGGNSPEEIVAELRAQGVKVDEEKAPC